MRQVTSNILTILQTLNPDTNGVDWPDLELSLANTLLPNRRNYYSKEIDCTPPRSIPRIATSA